MDREAYLKPYFEFHRQAVINFKKNRDDCYLDDLKAATLRLEKAFNYWDECQVKHSELTDEEAKELIG